MKARLLFVSVLFLAACTDMVEVEVDMSKYHTKQLAVSSYFPADSSITIYLSETRSAYASVYTLPTLKTALIEDLKTGMTYKLKPEYAEKYIRLYTEEFKPTEQGQYKLLIQTENPQKTIFSEDSIPSAAPVLLAKVIGVEGDELKFQGQVRFQADRLKISYYEIAIYVKLHWDSTEEETTSFLPELLTSTDDIITREDYYPGMLLFGKQNPSTLLFKLDAEDQTRTINFEYTTGTICYTSQDGYFCSMPNHDLKIELRTVSPAYFRYKTAVYQQQYAAAGDFLYGMAEPVQVKGNIAGGVGIFGGYSKTDTILQVNGISNIKNY